MLKDGQGVDTLVGGAGNDAFVVSHASAGGSVTGSGGNDTLIANVGDISQISIDGVQTLQTSNLAQLSLTADQLGGFSNIIVNSDVSSPLDLLATTAGIL